MTTKRFLLALFAIALPAAQGPFTTAAAQYAIVRTFTFQFLTIPTGTRNLALGQAGTADDTDPSNQYYNPSALLSAEGTGLSSNFVNWPGEVSISSFNLHAGKVFVRDGPDIKLSGALVYTRLHMDPPEGGVFLPEPGDFEGTDWHLSLALAAGVSAGIFDAGCGVAVKRVASDLGDSHLDGWAFDLGAMANIRLENESGMGVTTSLGFSVLNAGPQVEYGTQEADLPRQWRLGARIRLDGPRVAFRNDAFGFEAPAISLSLVGDDIDRRDSYDALAGGVEIGIVDVLFLRAGQYDPRTDDGTRDTIGAGLALNIYRVRATFDYATYELDWLGEVKSYGASIQYSF